MWTENNPDDRKRASFIEAARRAQVIEAAIETVAELGYARASLARIAEHAGISKSVISYHFSGKEELLEQVVTQVYDDCGEAMESGILAEETWSGKLAAYVTGELSYMRDNRTRMIAASEIATSHRTGDGTPLFLEFGVEDLEVLVDILEQGQAAGEFGAFDVRVAATTITHAVDGALTEWQKDDSLDLVAYGEELISLVHRAIRARG
ncbi:MAG: TetR/AcrR family transcriptional regulator [Rubrobacteraceae bacterium]